MFHKVIIAGFVGLLAAIGLHVTYRNVVSRVAHSIVADHTLVNAAVGGDPASLAREAAARGLAFQHYTNFKLTYSSAPHLPSVPLASLIQRLPDVQPSHADPSRAGQSEASVSFQHGVFYVIVPVLEHTPGGNGYVFIKRLF